MYQVQKIQTRCFTLLFIFMFLSSPATFYVYQSVLHVVVSGITLAKRKLVILSAGAETGK